MSPLHAQAILGYFTSAPAGGRRWHGGWELEWELDQDELWAVYVTLLILRAHPLTRPVVQARA